MTSMSEDANAAASAGDEAGGLLRRRIGFALLATFVLLSPAPGQLFGAHTPLLREWVMFSGVGVGIPRGTFVVSGEGGEAARVSPLEALGLEAYPQIRHYAFDRRILADEDFPRFAQRLCEEARPGARIGFEGVVGTRAGWREARIEDVCGIGANARTASVGEGSAP